MGLVHLEEETLKNFIRTSKELVHCTHSLPTSTHKEKRERNREMAAAKPRAETSERNLPCRHLDVGISSLQTMKNKVLLFEPPSPWQSQLLQR